MDYRVSAVELASEACRVANANKFAGPRNRPAVLPSIGDTCSSAQTHPETTIQSTVGPAVGIEPGRAQGMVFADDTVFGLPERHRLGAQVLRELSER